MVQLSQQAQEVFYAFNRAASGKPDDWHYLPAIAATLRAAANQVVPVPIKTQTSEEHWALLGVKNRLLAIADELEAE